MVDEETSSSDRGDGSLIDANVEVRQSLGFAGERAYVASLFGSEDDAGSDRYGIALTEEEAAELERRGHVQAAFRDRMLPAARAADGFAGTYIDQPAGGKVVVLTTGSVEQMREHLVSAEPNLENELVVRQVSVTQDELNGAARRLLDEREQHFGDIPVHGVSVDIARSTLVVRVPAERVAAARERSDAGTATLGGIAIEVTGGAPVTTHQ